MAPPPGTMMSTAAAGAATTTTAAAAKEDAARTLFSSVPRIPPDPMEELIARFMGDDAPAKLNLAVGAYRDSGGRPYVLRCVRAAEKALADSAQANHEYLPFKGLPAFVRLMPGFIFGDGAAAVAENRVYTVQTLSGSGALRIAAELLTRYLAPGTPVYLSDPTWPNHAHIFHHQCGHPIRQYRYLNRETLSIDVDGLLADLDAAPAGAVVVLQACAHNPTGVDPTPAQWMAILDLVARKRLFPVFDAAYQGFASGSCDNDAFAMRYAEEIGLEMICCHSFSKTAGLYNERIGALSIVLARPWLAELVEGQLKSIIRLMYLTPPAHGAAIVSMLLTDDTLSHAWQEELRSMIHRISRMRTLLVARLESLGTPHPTGGWAHITRQIGMFAFTGLTPEHVDFLESEQHIYLTRDGRLNIAAIADADVDRIASSIHLAVQLQPFEGGEL